MEELLERIYAKVLGIESQLAALEKKTEALGIACARAFKMTQVCVQELAEHQRQLCDDLGEFGGILTEGTTW